MNINGKLEQLLFNIERIEEKVGIESIPVDDMNKYWKDRLILHRCKPYLPRLYKAIDNYLAAKKVIGSKEEMQDLLNEYKKDVMGIARIVNLIIEGSKKKKITGISEREIEMAKSAHIYTVADRLGLEIKLGFISCPFHKEDTPSCKLYIKDNSYYCHGCHEHGDQIDLVRKVKGYTFKEAILFLLSI